MNSTSWSRCSESEATGRRLRRRRDDSVPPHQRIIPPIRPAGTRCGSFLITRPIIHHDAEPEAQRQRRNSEQMRLLCGSVARFARPRAHRVIVFAPSLPRILTQYNSYLGVLRIDAGRLRDSPLDTRLPPQLARIRTPRDVLRFQNLPHRLESPGSTRRPTRTAFADLLAPAAVATSDDVWVSVVKSPGGSLNARLPF